MDSPLLYEKQDGIAYITLNRPEARNALSPELVCRLADAVHDYAAGRAPARRHHHRRRRQGVLRRRRPRHDAAAADRRRAPPKDDWDRRVLDDPVVMAASSLRDYPLYKPVIAAINGFCLAGGAELILGTDIRVAAEHATFGFPEAKRAVVPFAGSMVRLPRQIPLLPRRWR